MSRQSRREIGIVVVGVPLALAVLTVAANMLLAGLVARLFAVVGWAPAGGLAGLGFWGAFFGTLALANTPAWAVCATWWRAREAERALDVEIAAALRWPARLDRWQPALWSDLAPPAPAARPPAVWRARLPYGARFACALAAPVVLLGLLTNL